MTTINENNISKLLQRDIAATNVIHIKDNTNAIPDRFSNRLRIVLQRSVPNAKLHRNMCKIRAINLPELQKDVPDILFDTEACHNSSCTSKSLVDDYREELCAY